MTCVCCIVNVCVSFMLIYETISKEQFLNSKFCRVLNVLCFLLGNSPASEFYMPMFRDTVFHLRRQVGVKPSHSSHLPAYEDGTDRVF